jgi:hypothetical protein
MLPTQLAAETVSILLNILDMMTEGAVNEAGSQLFQFLQ